MSPRAPRKPCTRPRKRWPGSLKKTRRRSKGGLRRGGTTIGNNAFHLTAVCSHGLL
ncbi:hypothetical protein PR202_gb09783 [Eleusine coracana subsp. coracana]|uniref:Uncharacterized protein n=1 Tax=Eleusine coracana subsp. coracana TaxID=191504 RepID=A0AAV5EHK6_ELECO|nr:hypothetical protein PR202_gb09783 [Eleusine coracana subsp. coracana]